MRKYREVLEQLVTKHSLEAEIHEVKESIQRFGYDETIEGVLNGIDNKFAQIRLEAEAQCAKIVSYPWSFKLRNAQRNVAFWRLWLSELKLGKDFSIQRGKIKEALDQPRPTMTTATKELRAARRELREALKKAKELRVEHLRDLCNRAGTEGKEADVRAIQRILRAEAIKATFARLRGIMKQAHTGALNHVLTEDSNGDTTAIRDQMEINELLLRRNTKHFSQADGTPFTQRPITELLGRYGTNKESEAILNGEMDTNSVRTTEATKEIL